MKIRALLEVIRFGGFPEFALEMLTDTQDLFSMPARVRRQMVEPVLAGRNPTDLARKSYAGKVRKSALPSRADAVRDLDRAAHLRRRAAHSTGPG